VTGDEVTQVAANLGLELEIASRMSPTGALFVVSVARAPEAGSWSMVPTEIAAAKDIDEAIARAKTALERMQPRLSKQLAQIPEPIEDEHMVQMTAGVSSDGVVTILRVERDGTVRLASEDIEAIAEAIYERLRAR
jgi:predicted RNase H-like HicB family nuclease